MIVFVGEKDYTACLCARTELNGGCKNVKSRSRAYFILMFSSMSVQENVCSAFLLVPTLLTAAILTLYGRQWRCVGGGEPSPFSKPPDPDGAAAAVNQLTRGMILKWPLKVG